MAFDSQGRMFLSADYSGEVYVILRDETSNGTAGSSSNSDNTGGKSSDADRHGVGVASLVLAAIAIYFWI